MPSGRPTAQPLGLHLTRTARAVAQAFDRAMTAAGGSAATWQVLLLVRSGDWSTQSQLAKAMGVTGATLTHHLKGLEADGVVRRWREPANGRVQRVELTPDGARCSSACGRSHSATTSACGPRSATTRSASSGRSSTGWTPVCTLRATWGFDGPVKGI